MADNPQVNIQIDADGSRARAELKRTGRDFDQFNAAMSNSGAKDKAIDTAIQKRIEGIKSEAAVRRGNAREEWLRTGDYAAYRRAGADAAKAEATAYVQMAESLRATNKWTPERYSTIMGNSRGWNQADLKASSDLG